MDGAGELSPYPSADGISNNMVPPILICGMPNCQPSIKLPKIAVAGDVGANTDPLAKLPV